MKDELLVTYNTKDFPKKDWIIIEFPDVQFLMGYSWFRKECYLLNSSKMLKKYGSSAYYVPKTRYDKWVADGRIPAEEIDHVETDLDYGIGDLD